MRLSDVGRSVLLCLVMSFRTAALFGQSTAGELGSIAVHVRPPNAEIFIDGERWVSPDNSSGLVVQLPPGRHAIEIRAQGFRGFSTVIDVRRGETTPLNVSLLGGNSTPAPPGPPAAAAPGATGHARLSTAENGFAIAPDFRVTRLNDRTTAFAGLYGGRVFSRRLLVGAGGYWQTNESNSVSDMAYGGAVVEWRVWSDHAIGFNLHGLGGYGQVRSVRTLTIDSRTVRDARDPRESRGDEDLFRGDEGFWVGEPEVQVVARFARHFSLKAGVGYRLTSLRNNDLGGASGSVSLQFGR